MPTLELRPRGVDILVRPGNANTVAVTYPAVLTGRTFTANVDGTALPVVVDGATVKVTFTAAITSTLAGRLKWQLFETTTGSQMILGGRVLASESVSESQDSTVTVVLEEATVAVTVLGAPGLSGSETVSALVDAKGDLLAGSAPDTLARLPVGADGQVLTADAAVALGVKWAAGGGGGGTAATTVTSETAFGVAPAVGTGTAFARNDHTHGSPALGTTGTTAAAGNDARLSDARTPLDGSVTTVKIVDGAVTAAKVAADVATQAELDAHGHTTVPVTTVTTTGYTLALGDAGRVVRMTFAGASTLTVPTNATAGFPVGTIINAYAQGGGLTISPATGVTVRNNGTALAQYGEASLRKDGTDEWVRVG